MRNTILTRLGWQVSAPSYKNSLSIIGVPDIKTDMVMKAAKQRYGEILNKIPVFGKNDILFINLLSATMLAAVYLSLDNKPDIDLMKQYYESTMNSSFISRNYLKNSNFMSLKYQNKLKKSAEKSQNATNPYTWRFNYMPGKTNDRYDAIFDKCGICNLMKDLGIPELTPAMCAYDYTMAEIQGYLFTRQYTLASGGPVCDCHYQRKNN